jgi:DNA-binding response OmpR family regulator
VLGTSHQANKGRPRIAAHKRILFVDDEPSIRATLSVILRKYGFEVTVASSVPEALNQIEVGAFDLLLCDLNINRVGDGFTVIRAIRQVNPRCVTIVLTGFPDLESAVEGIHQGVDDYIAKPISPDALVAVLAEKLAAREPKGCILSVSYDEPLLRTRHMLLEREGYEVASVMELETGLAKCNERGFDVFILGHSIDHAAKQRLVETFRGVSEAPIISLRRNRGEQLVAGADFHIEPDPEPLLKLIREIVHKKANLSSAAAD